MTINLISLIFILLLPLKASNTVTDVMTSMTSERFTRNLLTREEGTSFNPISEVSDMKVTPSIRDDVSPTKEKNSTKPSLQTTQTMLTKTLLLNTEKTAIPTNSILPPSYSTTGMMRTTEEQATVIKSTRIVTNQASTPIKPTKVLPVLYNSSHGQDKENTSIVQFTTNNIAHLSTRPPQSTNPISNPTTFTNTKEITSENIRTLTSGDLSTRLYKTSSAIPPIMSTEKMTRKPEKQKEKPTGGTNHGYVVAGLIGGALLLMMVGFLVIYIKKRKLQMQTITTTDWAGPSPFLEGGAENGQGAQRSPNRISLTTFLPLGVVKRLSLLPEPDAELKDVAPGTTFRDQHHNNTFGGRSEGGDIQESNETVEVVPEMESMRDPAEAVENTVSVTLLQTNKPTSSNTKVDFANLSQDNCVIPLNTSADAQTQLNNDLGQT